MVLELVLELQLDLICANFAVANCALWISNATQWLLLLFSVRLVALYQQNKVCRGASKPTMRENFSAYENLRQAQIWQCQTILQCIAVYQCLLDAKFYYPRRRYFALLC